MLYSLVYISISTRAMDETELLEILQESRDWNLKHNLTGMLIYMDNPQMKLIKGRFNQVLEGEKEDVIYIFNKIKKDPRHKGILLLINEDIKTRSFAGWAMGFKRIGQPPLLSMPDYFNLSNDFLKNDSLLIGNKALNYLKSFYQINQEIDF